MTSIENITLEVTDTDAARNFYETAFAPDLPVRVRSSETPTSGFRGFTLSLVVSQPADADSFFETALAAGATQVKPAAKSLWGYGGVVQAPDGSIWQIVTSSKKNTGPARRKVDDVVLLLGVEDVKTSKQFYVDRGLPVGKSFGSKYVEFDGAGSPVTLSLYKRRALAKVAGVPPEGSGSHRLVIGTDVESFTDPDGFVWETATAP